MLRNLENSVLLPVTRIIVLIAMIIIVGAMIYTFIPEKNYTNISYSDISEKYVENKAPAEDKDFVIPESVTNHFDSENLKIAETWAESIEDDKKAEYWNSLGKVLEGASKDDSIVRP